MKRLLLLMMFLLTVILFNPFDTLGWIINDLSKISNKPGFEKMINEKHYLIKSLALNPHKMNKDTYNMLYTILNADWIAKRKMIGYVSVSNNNCTAATAKSPEDLFNSIK